MTDELGGVTVVYLLDQLALPEATPDPDGDGDRRSQAVGFDLDGLHSRRGSMRLTADCQEFNEDFASLYEPGVTGIDNALQGLVGTIEGGLLDVSDCPGMTTTSCLDGLLQRDVREGRLLLLLELIGVDSLEHDAEVMVTIYLAQTVDGAAPRLEERARVAAGQSFSTVRVVAEPATGDIFHHRLRVRWPLLDIPHLRLGYPTALSRAELRASVCAGGLFRGHMGGLASVDELVETVEVSMPGLADTARSIIESIADIGVSAAEPGVCEFVSTAYAIEGVPALRVP